MAENVASHLTVLLSDNENLKNQLTNYINVELNLRATYKDVKGDLSSAISDEEKKQLRDTISLFRAFTIRIKVGINVIKTKFKKEVSLQIDEDYQHIKETPLPKIEICERFVQNINDALGEQLGVAATFTNQA